MPLDVPTASVKAVAGYTSAALAIDSAPVAPGSTGHAAVRRMSALAMLVGALLIVFIASLASVSHMTGCESASAFCTLT